MTKQTSHQGNPFDHVLIKRCHYLQKKTLGKTLEIFQVMKDCTNTNSMAQISRTTLLNEYRVFWLIFFSLL